MNFGHKNSCGLPSNALESEPSSQPLRFYRFCKLCISRTWLDCVLSVYRWSLQRGEPVWDGMRCDLPHRHQRRLESIFRMPKIFGLPFTPASSSSSFVWCRRRIRQEWPGLGAGFSRARMHHRYSTAVTPYMRVSSASCCTHVRRSAPNARICKCASRNSTTSTLIHPMELTFNWS